MSTDGLVHQNVHGRKWGRGIRPYLLLPKIVCVSIFLGGVVSVLVLGLLQPMPATAEQWLEHACFIGRAYARVIVPGLLGVLAMGILLGLQHLRVFVRMRWFQLKLGLIVVCVPALHLFMRSRSLALQEIIARGEDPAAAAAVRSQMLGGTVATLAFGLMIVWLGRIKPRLGQEYGRTFSVTVHGSAGSNEEMG